MCAPEAPRRDRHEPYDVVVVGTTIAGLATAMLLARKGLRVAAVGAPAPDGHERGVAPLTRTGVLALAHWRLLDTVVASGPPAVERVTFHWTRGSATFSVRPSLGVEALYAPSEDALSRALRDAATRAGVAVRADVVRTSVHADQGRVGAVQVVTVGDGPLTLRGRLLVGADGVDSVVARSVGAATRETRHHRRATTTATVEGLPVDGYEWHFLPQLRIGLAPTTDGRTWVSASRPIGTHPLDGPGELLRAVADGSPALADRLRAASRPAVVEHGTAPPPVVRAAQGPGWALVGAAGIHHGPAGPEGFTGPLRDAELLARAVPGRLDPITLDAALADYELARDRVALPIADAVDAIDAPPRSETDLSRLLRRLSSAMVDEAEAVGGDPAAG